MTIIYVAENKCQCLAVTFRNNGLIRVQNLRHISEDENVIYEVNPVETFLGKSRLCKMTKLSGAKDEEVFNGNTILLEIGK